MAIQNKIAVGQRNEATAPDALKAGLAEFVGTFIFVFIGLGSASAFYKLTGPGYDLDLPGLLAIAIAHGLALAVAVAATANISGGHINPAVTFGLVIGGNLTVLRGAIYWVAQLLGATLAAVILKFVIVTGEEVPIHALGAGVGTIAGLVLEIILTFALVFVVYATAVDPNKGAVGVIAPLAIGFTVLAAIIVGAPYSGGSLNPARSFGPALANFNFYGHWIYWVGPLIGAAIAGLLYDNVLLSPESDSGGHSLLPQD